MLDSPSRLYDRPQVGQRFARSQRRPGISDFGPNPFDFRDVLAENKFLNSWIIPSKPSAVRTSFKIDIFVVVWRRSKVPQVEPITAISVVLKRDAATAVMTVSTSSTAIATPGIQSLRASTLFA